MKGILVVFMTSYLYLLQGSLSNEPISDAKAIAWYHEFTFWVYLTPLFGALLSDILFGKYWTILSLSIVYCLGHGALAFMGTSDSIDPAWMLGLGLGLIAVGRRHQALRVGSCGRSVRRDEQGSCEQDLHVVLLLHQCRGLHIDVADSLAARVVRASLGLRCPRCPHAVRDLLLLVWSKQVHPCACWWLEVVQGDLQLGRHQCGFSS